MISSEECFASAANAGLRHQLGLFQYGRGHEQSKVHLQGQKRNLKNYMVYCFKIIRISIKGNGNELTFLVNCYHD